MPISAPKFIETVYVAHAKEIEGIKSVFPQEPDMTDRVDMPMISMYFLLPEANESETGDGMGPGEDNDWRWEVSLYVSLTNYKEAQIQMRDLAQDVIDNFRRHRLDYDSHPDTDVDLFARSLTRRIPPTPEDSDNPSYLRGSWELRVTGSIPGDQS